MPKLTRIALFLSLLSLSSAGWAAFQSLNKVTRTARAQVTGGSTGGGGIIISIQAPQLPANSFYGMDAVIPVDILFSQDVSPATTAGLAMEMGYQMVDVSSQPIGALTRLPLENVGPDPSRPKVLVGYARIPRTDLVNIQKGGSLQYYIRAQQSIGDTVLTSSGVSRAPAGSSANALPANPFASTIIHSMQTPVTANGTTVEIPDLSLIDGYSSVQFGAGALSANGTLLVQQFDAASIPSGPGGSRPVMAFSFDLQGAQLVKTADVTLTYPANFKGKVEGTTDATGDDLALYWWDGFEWRILDRPRIDTTKRTVTATTTHFSSFALFAAGPVTAASVRPRERILTPNNDGKNDSAYFGISGGEDVKIFDIRGHRVRTLHGPGPSWDGTNDDGAIVESGVYIYQYVSQGERVSGVIAVAK